MTLLGARGGVPGLQDTPCFERPFFPASQLTGGTGLAAFTFGAATGGGGG